MSPDQPTKAGVGEGAERRGLRRGDAIERGFGSNLVAIGRDSPYCSGRLHKEGFRFTQQSVLSAFHLQPDTEPPGARKRHARTGGFPLLETNPKLLPPVAKAQTEKMLPGHPLSFCSGHWTQHFPAPNSLFVQRLNAPIERVFRNGLSSTPFWGAQAESPGCFVS